MTKKEVTQLGYDIIKCAIEVHKALGPGLLESVYEKCLKHELELNNFNVIQQAIVPVLYKGLKMNIDLRLDLLVNDTIIIEIKAVEYILPIHEAQILSYMKLLQKPKGVLINFHTENITKSTKHFVNEYFRELEE